MEDRIYQVANKTTTTQPSEDQPKEALSLQEQAVEPIKITDEDNVLVAKLEKRDEEADKGHKKMRKEWRENLKLFLGEHWEVALAGDKLPTYKSDTVINKYFPGIRNLVALETDSKPEPNTIAPGRDDPTAAKKSRQNAKMLDEMLDFIWDNVGDYESLGMPSILTEVYYDRYLYRDGYGRYFWNLETDDVDFESISPWELKFAPGTTSIQQAPYLIFERWRTRNWLEENYPDAKDVKYQSYDRAMAEVKDQEEDDNPYDEDETPEEGEIKDMVLVKEYWENSIMVVYTGKTILDKKDSNPYWESRQPWEQLKEWAYINSEQVVNLVEGDLPEDAKDEDRDKAWQTHWDAVDEDPKAIEQFNALAIKDQGEKFEMITNHWKRPRKPFVQFKGIKRSGQLRSDSMVQQLKKIAFGINLRKAQIDDNANATGNPQKVVHPSVTEEQAKKWTSKPGLKVRIDPSKARTEQAAPLPAYILQDMEHSERSFDDMLGHHEISRGGKTIQQTFGEASLLKEADQTPIRLYVRQSETAITEILNGWVQLMKLFYNEKHYSGKIGDAEGEMYKGLSRREIEDGIKPRIKVGSTMPTSQAIKRQEYTQLFLANKLDPLTYFDLMDFANPEEISQRLANWLKAMVISEDEQPQQVQPEGGDVPPEAAAAGA